MRQADAVVADLEDTTPADAQSRALWNAWKPAPMAFIGYASAGSLLDGGSLEALR